MERSGGTLKWLVVGAALGAGLALLFAPQSGKATRRELSRRLKGLKEIADETLEELRDGPDRAEEQGLRAMSDSGGAYHEEGEPEAERVVTPRGRADQGSAREELERRLAAARARRRQAIPDDEEPVA